MEKIAIITANSNPNQYCVGTVSPCTNCGKDAVEGNISPWICEPFIKSNRVLRIISSLLGYPVRNFANLVFLNQEDMNEHTVSQHGANYCMKCHPQEEE